MRLLEKSTWQQQKTIQLNAGGLQLQQGVHNGTAGGPPITV